MTLLLMHANGSSDTILHVMKLLGMFNHNDKLFPLAVGSSISGLSGLYTVAMKAAGASRRVFQLLDRVSSMPKSGKKCPLGLVTKVLFL